MMADDATGSVSAAAGTASPAAASPRRALWLRYRHAWSRAWALRSEMTGPSRLADETAFMPAALSLQETPVHPAPRRLVWAVMALFMLAVLWAVLGRVEVVAVATGRLVVSERTKVVQPLENAVVKAILVRDGDRVRAGQPLVELDATAAAADGQLLDEALRSARADALRASALLRSLDAGALRQPEWPQAWDAAVRAPAAAQLAAEWDDIHAKRARLGSELTRRQAELATAQAILTKLQTTLPLAQQREEDARRLAEQGFLAPHQLQDRQRERLEHERDLSTQRARVAEAQAALDEGRAAQLAYLAELRRLLQDRLAQAELRQQQGGHEQVKARYRQRLTVLKAPVDGTVQQLAVHTPGGVVTEAQALMVIVPDVAQLHAEVVLENKDIGFVRTGQRAAIKLETFPFTRYGALEATVTRVAADAVVDERRGAAYPATLTLGTSSIQVDGRIVRLAPGMNLTAEITTGERRVIEFLTSPLQRAGAEAMRER